MILILLLIIVIFVIWTWVPRKRRQARRQVKQHIPPSKKTIKVKAISPSSETEMLFEQADLAYYQNLARYLRQNSNPSNDLYVGGYIGNNAGINNIPTTANEEDALAIAGIEEQIQLGDYMYDDVYDHLIPNLAYNRLRTELEPPIPEINLYDPDSQNIHDTEVGTAVRKIYSCVDIVKPSDNLIDDILKYATYSEKSAEEVSSIREVLNSVKTRNARITNVDNHTELELLATTWKESEDTEKTYEQRQNIKDMLLTQIADTFSNGNVLCSTGFVNRIATALVVDDPDRFPKTKNMIHNEIMESAAFVRDVLEKEESYNRLNDADKRTLFKTKLNEKLDDDYDGILSRTEIDSLISPWIEHI